MRNQDEPECSMHKFHFAVLVCRECARIILGVDMPQYSDDQEPRASFCRAIRDVFAKLQTYAVGQSFLVLQFLLASNWGHPVLVAMMNADEVDEDKGLLQVLVEPGSLRFLRFSRPCQGFK